MDPGEEAAVLLLLEPGQGLVEDLVARLLDGAEVELFVLLQVEGVVVMSESLVQAPAAVEDERRDEGPGIVTQALEDLGQGGLRFVDRGVPVDPDAVIGRVHPRHDGGVRREGQRRSGGALLEEGAAGGQGVQGGGPDPGIAVAGQVVGPGRVHGDDDDVGLVHALLPPAALRSPGPAASRAEGRTGRGPPPRSRRRGARREEPSFSWSPKKSKYP